MDQLNIKVEIANRQYRLKINKDDEEVVRKAVKMINDKLNAYSKNYAFKDKQDLLAMIGIEHTTDLLNKGNINSEEEDKINNKLKDINTMLEKAL